MNTTIFRLLSGAALIFAATIASAQSVINVAFRSDPYTAASAVPGSTADDTWNSWSAPNGSLPEDEWGSGNLFDATGAATNIHAFATSTTGVLWNGGLPGNPLALFDSYWHINDVGTLTVTIGGLETYLDYHLYVYGARNSSGPETQSVSVQDPSNEDPINYSTSYNGSQSGFLEGTNYVYFAHVGPDKSGYITFTTTGLPNGFTLTVVPEPSTYAICAGLLVLGLAIWRRRAAN